MIRKERAGTNVNIVHDDSERGQCSTNPPRKRCLFDVDFEELPSSAGRHVCPYGNCIYSNYVFGFESRTERNEHMRECPFGDGNVPFYVATDGQMPSAKLINELVDAFPGNTDLKTLFHSLFLKSAISTFGNGIEMSCGNLTDYNKDSYALLESTRDVKCYKELGKLMFESDCGGGGGVASCDQSIGKLDNYKGAGQVGFQIGVIDEFLNEKSYLLDDDICLE